MSTLQEPCETNEKHEQGEAKGRERRAGKERGEGGEGQNTSAIKVFSFRTKKLKLEASAEGREGGCIRQMAARLPPAGQ